MLMIINEVFLLHMCVHAETKLCVLIGVGLAFPGRNILIGLRHSFKNVANIYRMTYAVSG